MNTLERTSTATRGLFLDVGHHFDDEAGVQALAEPAFESLSHDHPPIIVLNCHETDRLVESAYAFLEELAWRSFEQGARLVVTEAPLDVRRELVLGGIADSCTLMLDGRASARVLPARITRMRS